jgi:hypothetical protein
MKKPAFISLAPLRPVPNMGGKEWEESQTSGLDATG